MTNSNEEWEKFIDEMTHEQMARFYRFSASDHPIAQSAILWSRYKKRFDDHGGMTVVMSKRIGL